MGARGAEVGATERQLKALELRAGGASYRRIGQELGVSHTQAWKDVMDGLADMVKDRRARAQELLELELARLEFPMKYLLTGVIAGDIESIDQWRRLCEARVKILMPGAKGGAGEEDPGDDDLPATVIDIGAPSKITPRLTPPEKRKAPVPRQQLKVGDVVDE